MGTSKAYGSPKWPDVNPAVGGAVSSGSPSDPKVSAAIGAFAGAYKNYLTSGTITSGGGKGRGGFAVAGQRPSSGGGRAGGSGGAARSRSARGGARLAQFISTARESGLGAALQEFDLSDLRGKPLDEFLDSVAERLSGDGGLLDDEALNRAMAETVNELAETVDSVDELDALLTSGDIDVEAILQVYFANILAANFEQKEYSFVREKISREDTKGFFARARQIIRAMVRDELSSERDLTTIDWSSAEGQRIADEINQEVLDILIP
jgi:hypothetical protein